MIDADMRFLTYIVALAALIAVISGVAFHRAKVSRERAEVVTTRRNVHGIERTIRVKGATGEVEINGRGWPVDIDPAWFGDNPPENPLLSSDRPWLEIAPHEQAALEHPRVRIAFDRSVAAFWYNPANGAIRARVPMTLSDRRAVELYNSINGVFLHSIFEGVGDQIVQVETPDTPPSSPNNATTSTQPVNEPD
jgi:hypothetical protein